MKIQIISTPRSGSAYLRSMLDSYFNNNENYFSLSEPFNSGKFNNSQIYENYLKIINSDVTVIKTHIHELVEFKKTNEDSYYSYLGHGWYNIILKRKDTFEATLSRVISEKTGNWDNPEIEHPPIYIEIDYFFMKLKENIFWNRLLEENVLKLNYDTVIYYEDLSFIPKNDISMFNFKVTGESTYTRKKMPDKTQRVSNYEELKSKTEDFLKTHDR